MKNKIIFIIFILLTLFSQSFCNESNSVEIIFPRIILKKVPVDIKFIFPDECIGKQVKVFFNDEPDRSVLVDKKEIIIEEIIFNSSGKNRLNISTGSFDYTETFRVISGWFSLIAPIVAIGLALITKEMILSLFAGIWAGVTILNNFNPLKGFFNALNGYVVSALSDHGHASIIIFSLLFGGMIGILSRNGGMLGIVNSASKYAKTRKRGQIVTLLMGIVIFFDDYSNSLLVGNTMRPFTDKLKISREKLSYLVDSTAAPVANLAFISTWSIFQMSLLDVPYKNAGINSSPYITFLKSIPFGFYSIFAIWLLIWLSLYRRDFGPMFHAERRAVTTGKVLRDGASPLMDDSLISSEQLTVKPAHWIYAIIPILIVIITTIAGLYVTGVNNLMGLPATFQNIIGNSDSYSSLMWGAALGGFVGLIMSISGSLLSLKKTMEAWLSGVRSMLLAAIILCLAWTLGNVCESMQTAEFIITGSQNIVRPEILPFLSFLLAAAISFSTGTSWGTMTILIPLIIPLALKMTGNDINSQIFLASFAAILSGATFGDHCSPISDTTILSSMASGADHVDHVKTQIPYALTAGSIAAILGYIPIGFGVSKMLVFFFSLILILLIVRFVGRKVDI